MNKKKLTWISLGIAGILAVLIAFFNVSKYTQDSTLTPLQSSGTTSTEARAGTSTPTPETTTPGTTTLPGTPSNPTPGTTTPGGGAASPPSSNGSGSSGGSTGSTGSAGSTGSGSTDTDGYTSPDPSPVLEGNTKGSFGLGDLTHPTITSIAVSNLSGRTPSIDAKDYMVITFSEKIDPASINPNLHYDGKVTQVGAGKTGNVTAEFSRGEFVVTIKNIATFVYELTGYSGTTSLTASSTTVSLDSTGTKLIIALESATGGSAGAPVIFGQTSARLYAGSLISGTVKDVAGNAMKSGSTPTPTGTF